MEPRAIIIGVLAAATVAGLGLAFSGGASEKASKRAKEMNAKSAKAAKRGVLADSGAQRRSQFKDSIKDLGAKEKQARRQRMSLKNQIEQAGLKITPTMFWVFSGISGVVFFVGALMLHLSLLIAFATGLAGGLGAPRWFLGMQTKKRQKKFVEQFADSIDIIVRGVKSGLPLNECLRIIARESPEPCKSEFVRLVDGQAVGMPIEQGLQKFFNRMPVSEVNFFNTVLLIQMKAGGNLSEALGNLSTVIRARKMMREKIGALSAEAKASAMIIGSLPFLVAGAVYIMTPSYIMELFITPTGHLILIGCGIWMGSGIMMMRKMINFSY
jgi:tight adherence protein B